jgi:hypothetical protein
MALEADSGTFGLIVEIIDITLSLCSIGLNLLVAYILITRLRLIQSDTVVSFIICLIDLVYSTFSVANLITIWSTKYQFLQISTYFCQFNGLVYTFASSSVADIIMILAGLRFLAICCNRIYSIKSWVIISSLLIIFNLACSLVSFVNKSFQVYPSIKYCTFNPDSAVGVIIWYILGIKEGVALVVIIFCYLRIANHYSNYIGEIKKDNNKLISQFHPKDNLEVSKNTTSNQLILDYGEAEQKVKTSIRKIYFIIAVYGLEFIGFLGIQFVYKIYQTLPHKIADNIFSLLSHCIPLTSPLFVLFFHDETNHELQSIVYLWGYRVARKFGI